MTSRASEAVQDRTRRRPPAGPTRPRPSTRRRAPTRSTRAPRAPSPMRRSPRARSPRTSRGGQRVPVGGRLDAGRPRSCTVSPSTPSSCWIAVSDLVVGTSAEMPVADAPVAVEGRRARASSGCRRRSRSRTRCRGRSGARRPSRPGPAHAVELALEGELGSVRADYDQAAVAIRACPRPDVGQRADPVDARVRAELDGHDVPAQVGGGERLGVEPVGRAIELRERAWMRRSRIVSAPPRRRTGSSASRKTLKTSRKMPAAIGTARVGARCGAGG